MNHTQPANAAGFIIKFERKSKSLAVINGIKYFNHEV